LAVKETEVSGGKIGFGFVEGLAEVGDGGVLEGAAQAVDFDRQGFGDGIGTQVGRGHKKPTEEGASVVITGEGFADFARQGALRAAGDHLEGVDEVLALRTQMLKALGFRQFFQGDFPWHGLALGPELFEPGRLSFDLLAQARALPATSGRSGSRRVGLATPP